MEIIVEGKGIKYFVPNQITLNLNFITKENSYEKVLEYGSKNVEKFINTILKNNNFSISDMKTRNFVIREETKYNEETRKYEFDGYSYNQRATLSFDYNKEKLSKMMKEISKLPNPPFYQINFEIKDERECRRNILKDAYLDAENQANAIALASGKTLKQCVKVDFKPFTTSYISQTTFGNELMYSKKANISETINNIFTPEDIELTETLYCLWIAE